jgi:predicted nucleotidyltransferase
MRITTPRHNPDMPFAIAPLLAPQGPVVAAIRSRFANAMAIYAFGSQVQGTAIPDSDLDLDLAVLVAGYADPLVLWDLAGNLADMVGCPVDLPAGLFETYVLSEKTALDEARAPLMADIQRTGKIYGR